MGKKTQIEVVGIFPTEQYQKCKYYADYLYRQLPHRFNAPKYRPMLDVQWTEFLTKQRRLHGLPFWKLESPAVVVFFDGSFFGDYKDFTTHCNINYTLYAFENFDLIGKSRLLSLVRSSERNFVYFIISIDDEIVGTLLIQLYNDLVPLTCSNFLRLIQDKQRGYTRSPIHRITKSCWIQVGGNHLRHHNNPCENYYVPHDQRGVVSMCNAGKHSDNNTQFFISLQKNTWMDGYYVAFGQVVHGEEILQKIEAVETKYDSPVLPIVIEDCGEYAVDNQPDKKFIQDYEHYIGVDDEERMEFKIYPDDISDCRDVDSSETSEKKFNQGLYSLDYVGPPRDPVIYKTVTPVASAAKGYFYV